MVAQVSESTTFGLVPYKQFGEMKTEKPAVMRLWYECWECDPYGSRWMKMSTHLTGKTLKEAKARIRALGLFEFKSEVSLNEDGSRHWQMYVINLQGSKATGAVKTPTSNRTGVKNYPTRGNEIPQMGQNSTLHGVEKAPSDPAETQAGQGLQQSSLSFNNLKESTTISESGVAAFSFDQEKDSISSPTNLLEDPSILSQTPPPENPPELISNLVPGKPTVCDSNQFTQVKDLEGKLSVMTEDSAPSHVILRHDKPQSPTRHQKPLQATSPIKTSNPIPPTPIDCLDAFSEDLENSLSRLISALENLGRLDDWQEVWGLKDLIRTQPTQVAIDAIDHVVEKLSGIKVLGAYMRKALTDGYKPTRGKIAVRMENLPRQEPKPAPEALEDFLSEENLEMLRRVNLEGEYLYMCHLRLREYWQAGDKKHEQIIDLMRQMQKNKLPFVLV